MTSLPWARFSWSRPKVVPVRPALMRRRRLTSIAWGGLVKWTFAIYAFVFNYLHWVMQGVLQCFIGEGKGRIIICSQYHSCWWRHLGYRKVISRHGFRPTQYFLNTMAADGLLVQEPARASKPCFCLCSPRIFRFQHQYLVNYKFTMKYNKTASTTKEIRLSLSRFIIQTTASQHWYFQHFWDVSSIWQ